jgi:hypothetical protein
MIVLVGIKHDLQWKWKYKNDIEIEVYGQNLLQYLPWLDESVDKNQTQIVGEEAGAGMFLEDVLQEHGCQFTFLQEIANKRTLKYFCFDLPREELCGFGIKPELTDYRRKEGAFSAEDRDIFWKERERWFHKTITASIRKDQNGLAILGVKHLPALRLSLQQSGYEVIEQDVTQFQWYKDPTDEAHRRF